MARTRFHLPEKLVLASDDLPSQAASFWCVCRIGQKRGVTKRNKNNFVCLPALVAGTDIQLRRRYRSVIAHLPRGCVSGILPPEAVPPERRLGLAPAELPKYDVSLCTHWRRMRMSIVEEALPSSPSLASMSSSISSFLSDRCILSAWTARLTFTSVALARVVDTISYVTKLQEGEVFASLRSVCLHQGPV